MIMIITIIILLIIMYIALYSATLSWRFIMIMLSKLKN